MALSDAQKLDVYHGGRRPPLIFKVEFVGGRISSRSHQVNKAKTEEVLTPRAMILAQLIDCILDWRDGGVEPTDPFIREASESRESKSEVTDRSPSAPS